nr:ABC transporter substrate-binding protein [Nocardioides alcanivorans]
MPIIDSETIDDFTSGKEYIGTGPFVFDSWTPNQALTFSRNDDYWGEKAKLDGVQLRIIKETTSAVSALRGGQVDMILQAGARDLEELEKSDQFHTQKLTGFETQVYVGTNVTHPALADVEVRQAIAYAVDKERIAKEVYRGRARAHDLPWPEYSPAYDAELDHRYARDVAKAKELLKGHSVPKLPITYGAGNPQYEAVAQIVQANLAEVGIETELEPIEYSQFLKKLIGADYDALWVTEHAFAQYTPSTLSVSAYPFNADHNASRFVDADYKAAAEAAWKIADGHSEEALAAYDVLSEELLDNLFLIELVETTSESALSKSVSGIEWSKRGEIDLVNTTLSK